jgi:hypothetical protein
VTTEVTGAQARMAGRFDEGPSTGMSNAGMFTGALHYEVVSLRP